MSKLPVEIKQKWVEALRSGEYKQGQYRLYNCDHNAYCCLGVLCVVNNWKISDDGVYVLHAEGRSYKPLYDLIGSEQNKEGRTFVDILSGMNDRGKSFKEIADFIEENL